MAHEFHHAKRSCDQKTNRGPDHRAPHLHQKQDAERDAGQPRDGMAMQAAFHRTKAGESTEQDQRKNVPGEMQVSPAFQDSGNAGKDHTAQNDDLSAPPVADGQIHRKIDPNMAPSQPKRICRRLRRSSSGSDRMASGTNESQRRPAARCVRESRSRSQFISFAGGSLELEAEGDAHPLRFQIDGAVLVFRTSDLAGAGLRRSR